jgi:hypothetical protein
MPHPAAVSNFVGARTTWRDFLINEWPDDELPEEEKEEEKEPEPVLYTTDYVRNRKHGKRLQGFRLDFKLRNPIRGTIYQTIQSTLTVGDRVEPYSFTEAWRVRPQRRKSKIDQNGTDSFLVPGDQVNEADGQLDVIATAWFEPGEIDDSFEKGTDEQLWGLLYGHNEMRAVPEGAQTIYRHVLLKWKKGGPVEMELQFDYEEVD